MTTTRTKRRTTQRLGEVWNAAKYGLGFVLMFILLFYAISRIKFTRVTACSRLAASSDGLTSGKVGRLGLEGEEWWIFHTANKQNGTESTHPGWLDWILVSLLKRRRKKYEALLGSGVSEWVQVR